MSEDNVSTMPGVRRRAQAATPKKALELVQRSACQHSAIYVDRAKAKVECQDCGEQLDPMWALAQLASRDGALYHRRDALLHQIREENRKMARRHRYKCGRCGTINDVSLPLNVRALDPSK